MWHLSLEKVVGLGAAFVVLVVCCVILTFIYFSLSETSRKEDKTVFWSVGGGLSTLLSIIVLGWVQKNIIIHK